MRPVVGAFNPPRASAPVPHLSAGKHYIPQRYIVAWPDGVLKVGSTWNGRQRWGKFLNRGATMVDLAYYEKLGEALDGEIWMQRLLDCWYPRAFDYKEESLSYLGDGSGYLECYKVSIGELGRIANLARLVSV